MTAGAPTETSPLRQSSAREISVEQLVGRRVRDPDGNTIGRIEEMIAEIRGTDWVLVEVHVGPEALLERLIDISMLVPLIGRLANRSRKHYRLAWDQLDLADPDHPRSFVLRDDIEDL